MKGEKPGSTMEVARYDITLYAWRAIASIAVINIQPDASAQGLGDSLTTLKDLGFDPTYLFAAVGLLVLIVAFYLFMIVFKRMRSGSRNDIMSGISYLDVTGMGKQGLLTPEEMAKVRQAMSRQLNRQQQVTIRPPLAGELGLLADPDVQRLEAIAQAKQRGEPIPVAAPAGAFEAQPTAPTPSPMQYPPPPPVQSPAPSAIEPAIAPEGDEPFPAFIDPIPANWTPKPATAEPDVKLPPDIETLVQNGLITPEELEVIKQRIRARGTT